jgi:hypothetical protein
VYGATVPTRTDRSKTDPCEREQRDHLDRFLLAVSSGWPQVMSFLESCPLDYRAREILRELQISDGSIEDEGGVTHHVARRAA